MNPSKVQISILTDNVADSHFLAEHGLSYHIEYDNERVLLDTGNTDVFLQNARRLNIDMDSVGTVALSHGHWDHGNGLKYLKDKKLVCHPGAFSKRYGKNVQNDNNGLDMTYDEVADRYEIILSKEPHYLSDKILFLGEIPRIHSFESKVAYAVDENNVDDFILDDSAIVIIHNGELIILSGCAHSGICNIVDYAIHVTGINKISTVMGGFHLFKNDEQTEKTIVHLKKLNVRNVMPSHCTQLPAMAAFYQVFKFRQVKAGMVFVF